MNPDEITLFTTNCLIRTAKKRYCEDTPVVAIIKKIAACQGISHTLVAQVDKIQGIARILCATALFGVPLVDQTTNGHEPKSFISVES
ncbi:MAG: hypothetical protein ACJZ8O_06165 [Pirellulaceae bacterium]